MRFQARTKSGQAFEVGGLEEVAALVEAGRIRPGTPLRRGEGEAWTRAVDVPELRHLFPTVSAGVAPESASGGGGDARREEGVRRTIATLALVPVMAFGLALGGRTPLSGGSAPPLSVVLVACAVMVAVVIYLLRSRVFDDSPPAMIGFGLSALVVVAIASMGLQTKTEVAIRDRVIAVLESIAVGEPVRPQAIDTDGLGIFAEGVVRCARRRVEAVERFEVLDRKLDEVAITGSIRGSELESLVADVRSRLGPFEADVLEEMVEVGLFSSGTAARLGEDATVTFQTRRLALGELEAAVRAVTGLEPRRGATAPFETYAGGPQPVPKERVTEARDAFRRTITERVNRRRSG